MFNQGDHVLVFTINLPARGTVKLLAAWRGPYKVIEVNQEGRRYNLSNGQGAHFENVIPCKYSPDE